MKFIKNNFKKLLVLLLLVIGVVGLVNFNQTGQLTGKLKFKETAKEFATAKVIHPSNVKSTVSEIPLEIRLNRNLRRATNFDIEILEPNTPGIFEIVAERPTNNFRNYKYKLLKRGDLTTERLMIKITATESGILFGNRNRDYTIVNIDVRIPRVNTNTSSLRINRRGGLPTDDVSLVEEDRTNVRPLGVPERYYSKNESNTQLNLALDNNVSLFLHDSRNDIDEAASFKLYSENEQVFVEINDVNHVDNPNVVNLSEQNVAFINTSEENRDYSIRFETVYEEDRRPDKYLIELTSKSGPVNLASGGNVRTGNFFGKKYLWNKLDGNEYEILKYFPHSLSQINYWGIGGYSPLGYANIRGYNKQVNTLECGLTRCEESLNANSLDYYFKLIKVDTNVGRRTFPSFGDRYLEIYNAHPDVEEFELTENNSEVYLVFNNMFDNNNFARENFRTRDFHDDEFDGVLYFHENQEITTFSFDYPVSFSSSSAIKIIDNDGNIKRDFIHNDETVHISIPNSDKVYSIRNMHHLGDSINLTDSVFLRIRSNEGPVNLALRNSDDQNYNIRIDRTSPYMRLRSVTLSGDNVNGIDNLKFTEKMEAGVNDNVYFVDRCELNSYPVTDNLNVGFEGEFRGIPNDDFLERGYTIEFYDQHYSIRPLSSLNDLILFQITNEEDYEPLDVGC